jgi:hypothetical protein
MDNREKLFQEGSGGDSNSKLMGLQAKSFTRQGKQTLTPN